MRKVKIKDDRDMFSTEVFGLPSSQIVNVMLCDALAHALNNQQKFCLIEGISSIIHWSSSRYATRIEFTATHFQDFNMNK